MTNTIVFFLNSSLLALVAGIIWLLFKYYNPYLSRIDDQLHEVTVMLKELTQQLYKITFNLEEVSKTEITKADLVNISRVTNDCLEKVLWQMRFDEYKYESTAATGYGTIESGKAKINDIKKQRVNYREALDNTKSMKAILKNEDEGEDDYSIILKYMSRTGKDGANALHVLDNVRESRIR